MSPIIDRRPAGGPSPDTNPAATPAPDAAPVPTPVPDTAHAAPPPDAEPAPAPAPETISDDDLVDALKFLVRGGKANKAAIQKGLSVTGSRARALLREMEARGIIGPDPGPRKSREILVREWPPETVTTPDTPFTRAGGAAADLDTTATAAPADTGTPPAEPAPAEPAPAEPVPTPEPVPVETPSTTAETPPAPPEAPPTPSTPESRDRWESITSSFKSAYDRFMSKFRGEVQQQDEKEYKASWGDVAKNAASGFLSVAASYTGVKILADLPAWFYQKFWTNPAERQRLQDSFAAKDTETGLSDDVAIEQRKARLEQAINESKFLTKEKKTELLEKLQGKVSEYKDKAEKLRTERNEKIAKLLNEAIETRVKNTQLLKEGLNSALMVTGLAAMRGVAYGAVATYERHQEVAKRLEEKSKKEGKQFEKDKAFYKEWIVDGFTETLHNFIGGKEKFLSAKGAMNVVKGATNVLRAAGFADLAIAEWTGEGRSVESIIDTSLKAWEQKNAGEFFADNAKAPLERLAGLASDAKEAATESTPTPERWLTNEELGESDATEPTERGGAASDVEIPEAQIKTGLVKEGDGILKILERQGVEARAALEAAREAGIVRAGGDTRLTTAAIGHLSVFAETQPDGGIEIKFFDTERDKVITLAEARDAGFTYESGTVPGEIPTDQEIVKHVQEQTPDTEVLVDSAAPNDLLGGTFHLYTDAEGHFTTLKTGEGDQLTLMNDAIQELARQGHRESPEAKFILQQMNALLKSQAVDTPDAALPPEVAVDKVTGVAAGEPIKKFVGEAGKVKFIYNENGGVKNAWLPPYTPGRRDIEDSLGEWGLTTKDVKTHFFEDASRTHNDYRQFVRDAERLTRQEALLSEMEENGYSNSLEYSHLKKETEQLEKFVADKMTKEFRIKERPT